MNMNRFWEARQIRGVWLSEFFYARNIVHLEIWGKPSNIKNSRPRPRGRPGKFTLQSFLWLFFGSDRPTAKFAQPGLSMVNGNHPQRGDKNLDVFVPVWLVLPRCEATHLGVFDLCRFDLLKRSRTPLSWNYSWILVFGFCGRFFGGFFSCFFRAIALKKQAGKHPPKNPPKHPRFRGNLLTKIHSGRFLPWQTGLYKFCCGFGDRRILTAMVLHRDLTTSERLSWAGAAHMLGWMILMYEPQKWIQVISCI